jgi:hypothetical protein
VHALRHLRGALRRVSAWARSWTPRNPG